MDKLNIENLKRKVHIKTKIAAVIIGITGLLFLVFDIVWRVEFQESGVFIFFIVGSLFLILLSVFVFFGKAWARIVSLVVYFPTSIFSVSAIILFWFWEYEGPQDILPSLLYTLVLLVFTVAPLVLLSLDRKSYK